uniref:Uncharacterized protein n=1 Tax=Archaeoglobus fulgidus TaxID=2234 RepID=A0A7J2TGZ7_ARCFL
MKGTLLAKEIDIETALVVKRKVYPDFCLVVLKKERKMLVVKPLALMENNLIENDSLKTPATSAGIGKVVML